MGDCTKLSHKLLDLHFFCALGTTEQAGARPHVLVVKPGTSYTTDYNNGVRVVYDERGYPWILYAHGVEEMLQLDVAGFQLVTGAYVPHSNDGGHFVREVLPELMVEKS